jgi:anti-sigma B factor antagonist
MPDVLVSPDSLAGRADVVPPAFECSWSDGGLDAAWVHLAGELDIATTPQLQSTLRESQLHARLVVLDLRGLAFLDSSGVHAMIAASARARELASRLIVLRGPPNVDRAFTLSGSVDDVELYDLDPGEPPVQVLLRLAGEGLAS